MFATFNLGALTPTVDPVSGLHVYVMNTLVSNPDTTGEALAVALMDSSAVPSVLSFYDIGGGTQNITAVGGPAIGATSTNIPGSGPQSIQFDNLGNRIDGAHTQGSAVCFAAGTWILAEDGLVAVEVLQQGQRVETLDAGLQEIRHVVSSEYRWPSYAKDVPDKPIRIPAHCFGPGAPGADLLVSPQHRVLLPGPDPALAPLAPAKALCGWRGIRQLKGKRRILYVHVILDEHHILNANGLACESFLAGPLAVRNVDVEPGRLFAPGQPRQDTPARPILTAKEARVHVRDAQGQWAQDPWGAPASEGGSNEPDVVTCVRSVPHLRVVER